MSNTMRASLSDKDFIKAISSMAEGQTLKTADGDLIVEGRFNEPTHFNFHQRIFEPGMILKVVNSNVRIYVPADLIGLKPAAEKLDDKGHKQYKDRQIENGVVLPVDPKVQFKLKVDDLPRPPQKGGGHK